MASQTIVLNSENYIPNSKNQFVYNFSSNYEIKKDATISLNQCQVPNSFYNVVSGVNDTLAYIIPTYPTGTQMVSAGLSDVFTITYNSGNPILEGALIFDYPDGAIEKPLYIVKQLTGITGGTGTYRVSYPYDIGNVGINIRGLLTFVKLPSGCYSIDDINDALIASQDSRGFYFVNTQSTLINLSGNTSVQYNNKIYPITLSQTPVTYSNTFTLKALPTTAPNIVTIYGTGFTWAGPTLNSLITNNIYPQICFFYKSDNTTNNLANLLGFYCPSTGTNLFPSIAYESSGTPTTYLNSKPISVSSNSLSAPTPYAPMGSQVNALVVRCSLAYNDINNKGVTDVLGSFPVKNAKYGANIDYSAHNDILCKAKAGSIQQIYISFYDQNMRPVVMNDTNVFIKLLLSN